MTEEAQLLWTGNAMVPCDNAAEGTLGVPIFDSEVLHAVSCEVEMWRLDDDGVVVVCVSIGTQGEYSVKLSAPEWRTLGNRPLDHMTLRDVSTSCSDLSGCLRILGGSLRIEAARTILYSSVATLNIEALSKANPLMAKTATMKVHVWDATPPAMLPAAAAKAATSDSSPAVSFARQKWAALIVKAEVFATSDDDDDDPGSGQQQRSSSSSSKTTQYEPLVLRIRAPQIDQLLNLCAKHSKFPPANCAPATRPPKAVTYKGVAQEKKGKADGGGSSSSRSRNAHTEALILCQALVANLFVRQLKPQHQYQQKHQHQHQPHRQTPSFSVSEGRKSSRSRPSSSASGPSPTPAAAADLAAGSHELVLREDLVFFVDTPPTPAPTRGGGGGGGAASSPSSSPERGKPLPQSVGAIRRRRRHQEQHQEPQEPQDPQDQPHPIMSSHSFSPSPPLSAAAALAVSTNIPCEATPPNQHPLYPANMETSSASSSRKKSTTTTMDRRRPSSSSASFSKTRATSAANNKTSAAYAPPPLHVVEALLRHHNHSHPGASSEAKQQRQWKQQQQQQQQQQPPHASSSSQQQQLQQGRERVAGTDRSERRKEGKGRGVRKSNKSDFDLLSRLPMGNPLLHGKISKMNKNKNPAWKSGRGPPLGTGKQPQPPQPMTGKRFPTASTTREAAAAAAATAGAEAGAAAARPQTISFLRKELRGLANWKQQPPEPNHHRPLSSSSSSSSSAPSHAPPKPSLNTSSSPSTPTTIPTSAAADASPPSQLFCPEEEEEEEEEKEEEEKEEDDADISRSSPPRPLRQQPWQRRSSERLSGGFIAVASSSSSSSMGGGGGMPSQSSAEGEKHNNAAGVYGAPTIATTAPTNRDHQPSTTTMPTNRDQQQQQQHQQQQQRKPRPKSAGASSSSSSPSFRHTTTTTKTTKVKVKVNAPTLFYSGQGIKSLGATSKSWDLFDLTHQTQTCPTYSSSNNNSNNINVSSNSSSNLGNYSSNNNVSNSNSNINSNTVTSTTQVLASTSHSKDFEENEIDDNGKDDDDEDDDDDDEYDFFTQTNAPPLLTPPAISNEKEAVSRPDDTAATLTTTEIITEGTSSPAADDYSKDGDAEAEETLAEVVEGGLGTAVKLSAGNSSGRGSSSEVLALLEGQQNEQEQQQQQLMVKVSLDELPPPTPHTPLPSSSSSSSSSSSAAAKAFRGSNPSCSFSSSSSRSSNSRSLDGGCRSSCGGVVVGRGSADAFMKPIPAPVRSVKIGASSSLRASLVRSNGGFEDKDVANRDKGREELEAEEKNIGIIDKFQAAGGTADEIVVQGTNDGTNDGTNAGTNDESRTFSGSAGSVLVTAGGPIIPVREQAQQQRQQQQEQQKKKKLLRCCRKKKKVHANKMKKKDELQQRVAGLHMGLTRPDVVVSVATAVIGKHHHHDPSTQPLSSDSRVPRPSTPSSTSSQPQPATMAFGRADSISTSLVAFAETTATTTALTTTTDTTNTDNTAITAAGAAIKNNSPEETLEGAPLLAAHLSPLPTLLLLQAPSPSIVPSSPTEAAFAAVSSEDAAAFAAAGYYGRGRPHGRLGAEDLAGDVMKGEGVDFTLQSPVSSNSNNYFNFNYSNRSSSDIRRRSRDGGSGGGSSVSVATTAAGVGECSSPEVDFSFIEAARRSHERSAKMASASCVPPAPLSSSSPPSSSSFSALLAPSPLEQGVRASSALNRPLMRSR